MASPVFFQFFWGEGIFWLLGFWLPLSKHPRKVLKNKHKSCILCTPFGRLNLYENNPELMQIQHFTDCIIVFQCGDHRNIHAYYLQSVAVGIPRFLRFAIRFGYQSRITICWFRLFLIIYSSAIQIAPLFPDS